MRKFFQKFFFIGNEAAGVFLALTIFLLGPWLLANLLATAAFWPFWHTTIDVMLSILLLLGLLAVYPAILFLRGTICYLTEIWKPRPLGVLASGVAMFVIACITFLEALTRLRFKLDDLFHFGVHHVQPPDSHLDWLFQNLDWLYMLLALSLLVGSYLLVGKSYAIMAKTDFRKLFGRCVCGLWCIAIVVYLGTGIAAICSIVGYNRTLKNAGDFFGRELTNAAMGELFLQGREPDGEFWKALQEESKKYAQPPMMEGGPTLEHDALIEQLPPEEYAAWKERLLSPEMIDWLDRRFSKPLPQNEKDFSETANLMAMELPELSLMRSSVRREKWMVRFALENHDSDALRASLKRSANASDFLTTQFFIISLLVRIVCEETRATSLATVISSDLVDEAWLEELIREMQKRETRLVNAQTDIIYGEAVAARSTFEPAFLFHPRNPQENTIIRPSAIFLVLPKFCDFTFSNLSILIRNLTVRDFNSFRDIPFYSAKYILSRMLLPAYGGLSDKIHECQGFYRGITMLAKAELIKRRTGSYPQQLDDLPEDPCEEGKTMQYLYGDFETKISFWSPEEKSIVRRTQKIHGVKVWFTTTRTKDKNHPHELFMQVE